EAPGPVARGAAAPGRATTGSAATGLTAPGPVPHGTNRGQQKKISGAIKRNRRAQRQAAPDGRVRVRADNDARPMTLAGPEVPEGLTGGVKPHFRRPCSNVRVGVKPV